MASRFTATSANIISHVTGNTSSNTQNAHINGDICGLLGWKKDINGLFTEGTQLRRSILDTDNKGSVATASLNSVTGITYQYDPVMMRTVKKRPAGVPGQTKARVVFIPGHL